MFRVTHKGEAIYDAGTTEEGIVRGHAPGRHDVDEIRVEPFASGHTSRTWRRMIRHPDGRVEDEPWPWDQPGSRSKLAARAIKRDRVRPPDGAGIAGRAGGPSPMRRDFSGPFHH